MCVRVRACVCMCSCGLACVGLRGENCILMHNYYCIYEKTTPQHVPTSPATFVPTNPADASHFVTPSLFSLDKKSVANYIILRHTYCITLVQALTVMRFVTSFPAQIETRRQESTFVGKKLVLAILHSQNVRQ